MDGYDGEFLTLSYMESDWIYGLQISHMNEEIDVKYIMKFTFSPSCLMWFQQVHVSDDGQMNIN